MKAVVLLSGGIDSTVILAMAKAEGLDCLALSFDYGQRHKVELMAAKKIAGYYLVPQILVTIDPQTFAKSSLVGDGQVPKVPYESGIPSTYVPARNTLFLAYALGQCEIHNADQIHFGANRDDQGGYPDCRPEFFAAFQGLCSVATKLSVEGGAPLIVTPLIEMTKQQIIAKGEELGAPLDFTWSCYDPQPGPRECGLCQACRLKNTISSPLSPL